MSKQTNKQTKKQAFTQRNKQINKQTTHYTIRINQLLNHLAQQYCTCLLSERLLTWNSGDICMFINNCY